MPTRDLIRVTDYRPGDDPTVDPDGAPTPFPNHPDDQTAGRAASCAAQPLAGAAADGWQLMAARGRSNADPLLVVALAQGKTVAEAAQVARVSERTIYRRLQYQEFMLRIDEAQEEIVGEAVGLHAAGTVEAVATLVPTLPVGALRPAGVRHRYPGGEDLTGLRLDELVHPVGTEPLGHDHEQRPAVVAAEHARVARTVDLEQAATDGWTVVSMRDDWTSIFPDA